MNDVFVNNDVKISYYFKNFMIGSLPYKKTDLNEYNRLYGDVYYSVIRGGGLHKPDLPYGNMARLLLHYITDEALKSTDGVIVFGNSLSSFLRRLGLDTGGATMNRAKRQLENLFSAQFQIEKKRTLDSTFHMMEGFRIVSKACMEWNVNSFQGFSTFKYPERNAVMLTNEFLKKVQAVGAVYPVNLETLKKIKRSAFALDLYSWWTYKAATSQHWNEPFKKIKWKYLNAQFGTIDSHTEKTLFNSNRKKEFKRRFMKTAHELKNVVPNIQIEAEGEHLIFFKSDPDVPRKLSKRIQ